MFDKRLLAGFILVLVVIAVNAVVGHRNTVQLNEDANWVIHTQDVMNNLDDLLSAMKDAETGQRGFLITGDERYLAPYNSALSVVNAKLAAVRQLTKDNRRQQARLPRLEQLIRAKLDELALTIDLRRRDGFDAAKQHVESGAGKLGMDAIRGAVAEMENDERALLAERERTNQSAYRTALVTRSITAILAFVAVLALLWLMRRSLAERQKAAAVLHEQREWLRTTLTSIGDAVIATDTVGRLTFLNEVAEQLTGWSEAEAIGRPVDDVFVIVNEETRQSVENPIVRALRDGMIVGLANHTILIAKDGTERPIDDSAAPIRRDDGRVGGCVLVFRDITARNAMETELRERIAAQKQAEDGLREADRRKDEFLATLAHELRNPLAPILLGTELLMRAEGDADLIREASSVMERQVRTMMRLVDDLMDMTRITRGTIELRKEAVDLEPVLRGAAETCRPAIEAWRHQLTIDVSPEPLRLYADATRLTQVFSNVLMNAAKYTEAGGSIDVRAGRDGGFAVVSVKDTGIGISPEMLPRIFDMYTQADRNLERSHGGLGIGLSLVKRLVELHGGTVEARSEGAGRGSEFVVRLPLV